MPTITTTFFKKSNITWIGDIPEDWGVKRLKFLAKIETGYTPPKADEENYAEDGFPWIKPDNLDGLSYLVDSSEKISAKGLSGNPIVHKNDILVCCIGTVGKMGIAGCDLTFNQQINSVQFGNDVDKEFGKFLILSSQEEHLRASQVVVVPILNKTKQSNIYFPLPPLSIQTAIANFLDQKTSEIKKFIENKRKLIELLKEQKQSIIHRAVTKGIDPDTKLKDSGIPWIGEIPEDWEVKRLKYCVDGRLEYGANEPAESNNPGNPRYIRITDFGNDGLLRDDTFCSLTFEQAKDYLLEEGDILFARSGATVGKTFIFTNYNGIACFAGYLIRARANKKIINEEFLYLYTKSNAYEEWKSFIFSESTIQNIGADKYNNLLVPIPSFDTQSVIIKYIKKETSKIDTAIAKIEQEIALIEEYQNSLIYQAVTGKISIS